MRHTLTALLRGFIAVLVAGALVGIWTTAAHAHDWYTDHDDCGVTLWPSGTDLEVGVHGWRTVARPSERFDFTDLWTLSFRRADNQRVHTVSGAGCPTTTTTEGTTTTWATTTTTTRAGTTTTSSTPSSTTTAAGRTSSTTSTPPSTTTTSSSPVTSAVATRVSIPPVPTPSTTCPRTTTSDCGIPYGDDILTPTTCPRTTDSECAIPLGDDILIVTTVPTPDSSGVSAAELPRTGAETLLPYGLAALVMGAAMVGSAWWARREGQRS